MKKSDELHCIRVTAYGMNVLQAIREILRDQAVEACLHEPASQLPRREHRQPRAHHAVDRVDGSRGVIDSNDFNLFTRCFRKLFRHERIHLLGMRSVANPKVKINTERG